jgi:hypothetical protein
MKRSAALVLLIGISLTLSACATRPDVDVTIHESGRGAVYVERIPDRSLRADHPITLSVDTMARVLHGVVVAEDRQLLGGLLLGSPKALGVFRDEDIQFLAPLLVDGLTRAASDQKVGFRVVQTGMPWESTTGWIYAHKRLLYLTIPWLIPLSRYQDGTQAPPPTLFFFPRAAKRPESYSNARSAESTLVIDYDLLASLPIATGQNAVPGPATQTIQSPIQPSEREWDDMKKEMQGLKRQLADMEAERNPQKRVGPSKERTPAIP